MKISEYESADIINNTDKLLLEQSGGGVKNANVEKLAEAFLVNTFGHWKEISGDFYNIIYNNLFASLHIFGASITPGISRNWYTLFILPVGLRPIKDICTVAYDNENNRYSDNSCHDIYINANDGSVNVYIFADKTTVNPRGYVMYPIKTW